MKVVARRGREIGVRAEIGFVISSDYYRSHLPQDRTFNCIDSFVSYDLLNCDVLNLIVKKQIEKCCK